MANLSTMAPPFASSIDGGFTTAYTHVAPTASGGTATLTATTGGYGYTRVISPSGEWDPDVWIFVPVTSFPTAGTAHLDVLLNGGTWNEYTIELLADGTLNARANGGAILGTANVGTTPPRYIGIRRVGATTTAIKWGYSADGTTWTDIYDSVGSFLPTQATVDTAGSASFRLVQETDGVSQWGRPNTVAAADTTAPTVASAEVLADGLTLRVTYTEAGSPPMLPASGVTGYTFSVNGTTRTISSSTRSSSLVHDFTLSSVVYSGDTVLRSYQSGGGNVTDSATTPNALASFTDQPVTNSSTQTPTVGTTAEGGFQLVATPRKADASVARRSVAWGTSDPAVATVGPSGYVTRVAPGTCTITATSGGVSRTCAVTVT